MARECPDYSLAWSSGQADSWAERPKEVSPDLCALMGFGTRCKAGSGRLLKVMLGYL